MDRRTTAAVLLVVGLLLLPAPLYLGWTAEAVSPPGKTSQIYAAEPLDPANESDRETIVDRYWTDVAFSAHQLSGRYSHGGYRSPNASREALRTAMRNGSATVDDPGARADLREVATDYRYVTDTYADIEGFYRLRVEENGSVVRAEPVSADRIANVTAERAPRYENLDAGEQRTVDRILNNSTGAHDSSMDWGYRPQVNEPFVDRLPTLVWKDGTLYSVFVYGHVDDFGPGFAGFVVGLAVAALGLVLVLSSAVLYALVRLRESAGESSENPPPESADDSSLE